MDPLAHTLFGAALARTRLGRSTPGAMTTLVVAANLPDVDVLAYVGGPDAGLAFRRGWTHGPVGIALLPLLWGAVVLAWGRWGWRRGPTREGAAVGATLGLSYLGALSHPALDWLNTYGIRLLMPWSERWFYGDTLFIVDPWVWLLLGGTVFLVSGEGGGRWPRLGWAALGAVTTLFVLLATPSGLLPGKLLWSATLVLLVVVRLRRTPVGRRRVSSLLFVTFLLYVFVMLVAAGAARRITLERASGEEAVQRLMVGPLPMTPFTRDVVVQSRGAYRLGRFHWLPRPSLVLDERIPEPPDSPLVREAFADPCVAGFVAWARFPFVEIETSDAGWEVFLLDARYTRRRTSGFGGAVVEVERGRIEEAERTIESRDDTKE